MNWFLMKKSISIIKSTYTMSLALYVFVNEASMFHWLVITSSSFMDRFYRMVGGKKGKR